MSAWPLYRENILQGPAHVSLALPGKPSQISKSIGGTNPALLLIPNTEYLTAFINGNIGVGDATIKGMIHTALNQPFMRKDPAMIENYLDTLDLKVPDLSKYKTPNGEINLPFDEIQVPDIFKDTGIKALEKTIVTSIFETQKPYIEIVKLVMKSMISIEDVVARVMPLLAINPLTSKSERPIVKDGSSNGTKSIGFQKGEEFNKAIAELDKISKTGLDVSLDKDGNFTAKRKPGKSPKTEQPALSDKEIAKTMKKWEVVSTSYSTGDFDPSVEYIYSYVYLPEDEQPGDAPYQEEAPTTLDENPYDKYKPKRIILGVFKSDGTPLNPKEKLKTVSTDGLFASKVETPFNAADWVYKSPKWKFRNNDYIWPSFGGADGTPIYLWRNKIGLTRESKESPGDNWEIKRYKEGDKNRINRDLDAIPDDPIIVGFDTADSSEYTNYFSDFIKSKTKVAKDLNESEKSSILSDIMGKVDVQSHMQNVFLYGSGPNSVYNAPGIPTLMKKSFKPYQIYVPEAVNDPQLSGDGLIWLDPEADYDMKVIRVDPSTLVDYVDPKNNNVLGSEIVAFVKNKITFKLDNNTKFDIEVKKNSSVWRTANGVYEYTIENWNYENGEVKSLNFYNIKITDASGKEVYDETWTNLSLPDFGVAKTVTVSTTSFLDTGTETDTQIPLYNIKVTNPNSKDGLVISPDSISNDFLATEKQFSEGFYGNGTQDRPQNLEILKRFSRTDLDNESYYIIEGLLVDNKSAFETGADASGEDGKKWYRIPHAIGAIIPFIGLLVDLSTKLFPTINKLLKLLKDPTGMITDIIKEKVGDAFTMLSEPAFEKIKKTGELVSKAQEIIAKGDVSVYTDQLKRNFNMSPLKNITYVEEISPIDAGKVDFIIDGTAMVPFSIFGRSIPFGLELKMSNLIPEMPEIKIPDPNQLTAGVSGAASSLTSAASGVAGGISSAASGASGAASGLASNVSGTADALSGGNVTGAASGLASSASGAASGLASGVSGVGVTKPNISTGLTAPKIEVPKIEPPKIKSPFKLIRGKIGKAKTKDCDNTPTEPEQPGKSNSDYLSELNNQSTPGNTIKSSKGPNGYYIDSIWYSTGEYIAGVDYTYYYIREDTAELLKRVDELVNPGSTSALLQPSMKEPSDATNEVPVENIQAAKDLVAAALANDPDNELLKSKLKELNEKLANALSKEQPIIKMVLGVVSIPIKIVSCIVQWLLDFFKSLLNPMMLPQKIIELLSFEWIMKFFSTEGLLKTFGLNFNPAIVTDWSALANMPNTEVDINCGKLGGKLSGAINTNAADLASKAGKVVGNATGALAGAAGNVTGSLAGAAGNATGALAGAAGNATGALTGSLSLNGGTGKNINLKTPGLGDILKNLKKHCGSFLLPDDFSLADLSKFLSLPFMPNLPEYSSLDIKLNEKMTDVFGDSILCLIEKFINAFIDFIWALMGIEVIIPPPHIKLCKKKSPNETNKLNDGDTSGDGTTEVDSTNPYSEKSGKNAFVYEVTFTDGRKEVFRDYESLQKFIEENKDTSFDLQF